MGKSQVQSMKGHCQTEKGHIKMSLIIQKYLKLKADRPHPREIVDTQTNTSD